MSTVLQSYALVTLILGLPGGLLQSVCYVESNHRQYTISPHDGHTTSYGACQIKYETAKDFGFKGSEEQLMQPLVNIFYAGAYLDHQIKRYKGNKYKAVSAYNCGKVCNNRRYVKKVFTAWDRSL